jgi:hypothetical protein
MTLSVINPAGEEETREMHFISGLDNFNEGFDLARRGKYHFTVLLALEGKIRRAEFTHEVK